MVGVPALHRMNGFRSVLQLAIDVEENTRELLLENRKRNASASD